MSAFLGLAVMAVSAQAEALPPRVEEVRSRMDAASPPRVPAPFVLPDLAHDDINISMDWLVGRIAVNPAFRSGNRTSVDAALGRATIEANAFVPRRVFVGGSFPFGMALPPDGGLAPGEGARPAGMRRFTGNAEVHIRTVFPLPTWLEIGFVMGLLLPTATFERDYRPNLSAARAVATLDPTAYPEFLPGRFALRPAGDLRIRRENLIFQGRHGIDILLDSQAIGKTSLTGRLIAHIGYLARPDLEIAMEGSQFYFFATTDPATSGTPSEMTFTDRYRAKDGSRSAIAIGPSVRVMTRDWDYGIALSTNIADPLSPVADGFLGIRFSIVGHVDP